MKQKLLSIACLMLLTSTTAQIKLHPALSAENSIEYYEISPDGSTVVYIADRDNDDVFELYSVPVTGGTNAKLNGALVAGGDVSFGSGKRFQISTNSQTVVYLADQEIDGTPELYSVPISGGSVTKLNGTLAGTDGVRTFKISPNGQTVVYVADELDNFDDELYSVPIGGGTSTKISQADLGIGDVHSNFHISPDSLWVVYVANADDSSDDELYSVPIGGGTINKLNGTLVSGGDVLPNKVFVSSDSQRVVYVADQDTNFVEEVYSTPIGGGPSVKLNANLSSNNDDVDRVFISPDGQWVVYVAGNFTNQFYELFSVPIGGGTAVKLNGSDIDNDFDGSLRNGVNIGPESERVFYVVNTTNFSTLIPELFTVPIDGSEEPTNISSVPVTGRNTSSFAGVIDRFVITSLILKAVFMAALSGSNNVNQLFITCLFVAGGRNTDVTTIRLNGELISGGNVTHTMLSPDGVNAIYRADQDTNDVFELYSVPVDGNGFVKKLNGELIPNGDVVFDRTTDNSSSFNGIQVSSDGLRVVYMADQDTDGIFELYSMDYATALSTDIAILDNISIYYNNKGSIEINGIQNEKAQLEIYSVLGSRVFKTSFEGNGSNSIAIPSMNHGMYVVRLSMESGLLKTKKIVLGN